MQILDDRVVLGYGWLPYITEFTLDGSVLCDVELAPWVSARWGLVSTYRAFKARNWIGRPIEPPSIYLDPSDGLAFVSWNGATEVDRWVLQGADWEALHAEADGFEDLLDVKKDAFETCLDIAKDMPRYIRVAAVDRDGNVLMHTQMVDRLVGNAPSDWVHGFLVWLAASIILVVAVLFGIRKRGRRATCDLLARAVLRCRDCVSRPSITDADAEAGGVYGRDSSVRWWKYWGGAKTHEWQPLYQE
jgi:hypothetical protein